MKGVNLKKYNNNDYYSGSIFLKMTWYLFGMFFFSTRIPFPSFFKVALLKVFGASVGSDVVIKPRVNIKYPWFLSIGSNVWIGENVWIDNLAYVVIGSNVVLSQGAYLLTGSHNYTEEEFTLMTREIVLEDGVWIAAKSIVCPGVACKSHSVLSVGSVATSDLDLYMIYQGNPAVAKRKRQVRE